MADSGERDVGEPFLIEQGDWAGWSRWEGSDPFEDESGPFYFRRDDGGAMRCAFRAEHRHMNGGGFIHGGAVMTFADYSLFLIARDVLDGGPAVTVSLNGDFAGPARAGDLIEATGEVVRAGGSLIFVRGMIATGGAPMMGFSGVIKRVKRDGGRGAAAG
jgi:uncharacterized protein (TIGR00369 family)